MLSIFPVYITEGINQHYVFIVEKSAICVVSSSSQSRGHLQYTRSSGEIVREESNIERDKSEMSRSISLFLGSVRWQTSSREVACSSLNVAVVN